jgi:hypothetical protein
VPCSKGTFNDVPGASQCKKCSYWDTSEQGSGSQADCELSPSSTIIIIVVAFSVALIGAGCFVYRQRIQNQNNLMQLKDAEARVLEEKERTTQAELRAVKIERNFFRDWRIPGENIDCKKKLNEGAFGEVWQGTLHGQIGNVAIKKLKRSSGKGGNPKPWDEQEVSFMMAMQPRWWCTGFPGR